jgi:hypothetical protein
MTTMTMTTRRVYLLARAVILASIALVGFVPPAAAQESMRDVLSFLVTNRSIPTDDFVRDEEAAAATSDSIADFLVLELATLPISSSAGGFIYRFDPALGTVMRSSDSFGPFFTERSLTAGRGQLSVGISSQTASFHTIDGRNLRDGTLVSTATALRTEPAAFDVETVTLNMRAQTMVLAVNAGATDRLEVSAAVPFVRLTLNGQRLDTYRGREVIQAVGSATVSGFGDLVVRAKHNVFRTGGSGVSLGAEARLPTGDEDNLLGAGEVTFVPRLIASYEGVRLGLHANAGYAFGGLARELDYSAAVTAVAAPRVTVIVELSGRQFDSFGRLQEVTQPHPRLTNVETTRLTSVPQGTTRLVAVGGIKWNVASTLLVSMNVLRPLTSAGLNARWVPTVTLDYSFGA